MSSMEQSLKNRVLVGCLSAALQVPNLLAGSSVIDLGQVLNGFGFSVQEACTSDEMDGQCWLLSIYQALEHSQKYRHENGFSTTRASIRRTAFNHLNQHHLDEVASDWQPAHQLNALLAQECGLIILTIEVLEQGLLHIVLTTPSDTEYEQQIIFFGEIEQLLASDLQIAQTLQQLLLTADISLVLTPGHVQPVILTQYNHQFDESDISLPVRIMNFPARILMTSEIMPYSLGAGWWLRPDFNARYGAVKKRSAETNYESQLKDIKTKRAEDYQKLRQSERRWNFASRSIKALISLLTAGAGYYYREPIIRFLQPYWNNRAHYYDVTTKTLIHWGDSLKAKLDQFGKKAYPYWVSVQNTGEELLNRYYWQQDSSDCKNGAKFSVQPDKDGSYRTKGIIAEQTVELLVDSGATSVSMSARIARQLGFSDFSQKGERMNCNTASHMNIPCYRISLPSVKIGCITLFNVDATVMDSENDEILLGMSFLDRVNWSKKGRLLELQRL